MMQCYKPFCKANWFSLDTVFRGNTTTIGLRTCASASLGSNWEFVSRSKFQSTRNHPLYQIVVCYWCHIAKLSQRHPGQSSRSLLYVLFRPSDFPSKSRTNKNSFTPATCMISAKGQRFTTFVISHLSLESESQPFPVLFYPQWLLILLTQSVFFTNSLSQPNLCFRFSFFTHPIKKWEAIPSFIQWIRSSDFSHPPGIISVQFYCLFLLP